MKKEELAISYFQNGFNCAQSVLSSYKDEINLPEEILLKVASGFGAGMGRLQETCGAISGAYMVLGLKYGQYKKEDKEANQKTYALVREFVRSLKNYIKLPIVLNY